MSIPTLDVKNTETGVLVSFYNTHSGAKPIKKFVDRKTAEARVQKLIDSRNNPEAATSTTPVSTTEKEVPVAAAKKKAARKAATPKAKKTKAQISAAIAASWKDPKVLKARSTHDAVRASGTEYRSVPAAFAALKLPMGSMTTFRKNLKKEGSLVFTNGDKKITFSIVKG